MSKTLDTTSLSEAFIQFQLVRFLILSVLTALPILVSLIFISNRIQVEREEIQDFEEEIIQLEDKKKKLIKLVSVNIMFVKMKED